MKRVISGLIVSLGMGAVFSLGLYALNPIGEIKKYEAESLENYKLREKAYNKYKLARVVGITLGGLCMTGVGLLYYTPKEEDDKINKNER